jgi:hypothetical protein
MPYDPVLIDAERGSCAISTLFIKDPIVFNHFPLEIAEQRECHSYVFLEAFVGRIAVNADPQDLRVCLLEFGDIRLIRLQLLRSTAGEGEHVESEHHILLAAKVSEFHRLAVGVGEREIGR